MPVLEEDMTMYEMRFENEKSVNPAQWSSSNSKRHTPPHPSFLLLDTNLRYNPLLTMPCRCVTCSEQFLPGRIAVFFSLCYVAIFEMLPGLGLN